MPPPLLGVWVADVLWPKACVGVEIWVSGLYVKKVIYGHKLFVGPASTEGKRPSTNPEI